ncbi:SDR family oxidoreductase [Aliifodinibius sp. S!AR15-10]|uniref:SDR family oxidoreductase n=1 Tax=Aliifodinibius sp. S!AR15-10 TaxID=2950437 RepID=UPI002864068F|nr:SDR family oxidoreductase [Aliifodinibius sp. S!AR15-10]MDR8390090.1 SDR family oxidoreductase [Aliifodinibius sp. S!AR15-10]
MMSNLFDLSGKVAIVTGGTGVLGGAMAKGLAEAGAKIGILGRSEDSADENVKEIKDNGGEAIPLIADVLVKSDLQEARKKVLDQWGRIDILINAAGGNLSGATINPEQSFLDLEDEALENVMNLNFMGTYHPTKVFGEDMIENKQGSIIHISSMASDRAITRVLGYSAAKAAVDNFTKFLATELAIKYGDGLRVNAIAPGFFIGEQNRDLLLNEDGSLTDRGQTIVDNTPMNRFGEKEELIGTAVWLASEASKFVTGTVIPVDGGFSAFSGV